MAHDIREQVPERLAAFDIETNGLPDWSQPSESEQQPHIVQMCARLIHVPTRRAEQSFEFIVRPDGWTIPPELTEIHGITQEQADACGVPESMVLAVFLNLYGIAPFRLCYNHTFDARIVRIATKRFSNEATQDIWKQHSDAKLYHDPALVVRQLMGLPARQIPKLTDAYEYMLGRPMLDKYKPHTASGDIDATIELYWACVDYLEQHPDALG